MQRPKRCERKINDEDITSSLNNINTLITSCEICSQFLDVMAFLVKEILLYLPASLLEVKM